MKSLLLTVALFLCLASASAQVSIPVPNDTTTGTTLNKPAKYNTTSSATSVILATAASDQEIAGIVTAGAGTTNNAIVTVSGVAPCVFDNATTPNDYVQIASGGGCHDAGSTRPTSNIILGTVFGAGGAAGTYNVSLNKNIYPAAAAGSTTWPIFFTPGTSVSTNSTSFEGLGFTGASEAPQMLPVPRAGTISTLFCRSGVALSGASTYTMTVRTGAASIGAITASSTTLTCVLNSTNTQGCSDLTHNFAVAQGDIVDLQVVPANTPSAATINCSVLLQ